MIIKRDLVKRDIAGDTILVPVGKDVYSSNGLFILNELGSFIWDILPDAADEQDVLNAILEEYDVSMETASADLKEFLEKLKELNIL